MCSVLTGEDGFWLFRTPTCEHCNKALPPEATDAMICSFECPFCRACVDEVLENACPNCGGGIRSVGPEKKR
jgi:hypothetical protein